MLLKFMRKKENLSFNRSNPSSSSLVLLASSPSTHRSLTSSSNLHRMHVNTAMSHNLLPDYGGVGRDRTSCDAERVPTSNSTQTGTKDTDSTSTIISASYRPNAVLFRRKIRVLDEREREWSITYESLCSSGQRHTRLSAGWAALCKANGFKIGDTIEFSRWGDRENGVVVVGVAARARVEAALLR